MKGKDVVHSKGKDDWETPRWLFDHFNKIYQFGLDAAASYENKLCRNWFDEEDDALKQSWKGYGNVFVNPPYSLNQKFIEKIVDELDGTFDIVALVPSRTDTRWWHDLVFMCASQIHFIKGRLNFSNAEAGAPFPSCVIVFRRPITDWHPLFAIPAIYSLGKPQNGRHKSTRDNGDKSGEHFNGTNQ